MGRSFITDISILNSITGSKEVFFELYNKGLLSDSTVWSSYPLARSIEGLKNEINSPLRKRMSALSLGVYYALAKGGAIEINPDDEIYFFSAFGEIDTTNEIIKSIILAEDSLVSPTLFHNSVHNTPLSYYTIINKLNNYCATVSDGLESNQAFIDLINCLVAVKERFIVVTGEEYSDFYSLDKTRSMSIFPAFCSYKVLASQDKGFVYCGSFKSLEALQESEQYKGCNAVFADRESFLALEGKESKELYTDYPLTYDTPCAVAFRLALPFYLERKGKSAIVEQAGGNYHLFEVLL